MMSLLNYLKLIKKNIAHIVLCVQVVRDRLDSPVPKVFEDQQVPQVNPVRPDYKFRRSVDELREQLDVRVSCSTRTENNIKQWTSSVSEAPSGKLYSGAPPTLHTQGVYSLRYRAERFAKL